MVPEHVLGLDVTQDLQLEGSVSWIILKMNVYINLNEQEKVFIS